MGRTRIGLRIGPITISTGMGGASRRRQIVSTVGPQPKANWRLVIGVAAGLTLPLIAFLTYTVMADGTGRRPPVGDFVVGLVVTLALLALIVRLVAGKWRFWR